MTGSGCRCDDRGQGQGMEREKIQKLLHVCRSFWCLLCYLLSTCFLYLSNWKVNSTLHILNLISSFCGLYLIVNRVGLVKVAGVRPDKTHLSSFLGTALDWPGDDDTQAQNFSIIKSVQQLWAATFIKLDQQGMNANLIALIWLQVNNPICLFCLTCLDAMFCFF